MKFSALIIVVFLVLSHEAITSLAQTPCVNHEWSVTASGCSTAALVAAIGAPCVNQLFGSNPDPQIAHICQRGFDETAMPYEHTLEKQDPSFYKEYFDGNSFLNTERQTKDIYDGTINRLNTTAARINDVYNDIAQSQGITFPHFVRSNFDPINSCKLRAAMCCFVQDRQAGDGNGDCATEYDVNCVNADPADNTDLCYVDVTRSRDSPHLAGGWAVYPEDTEGPVHCHGLAWSDELFDLGARYRGNNLFYVSKYDHLYQRGYTRNVPLAPMCGCVENMPTVSESDCTELAIQNEVVEFSFCNNKLSAIFKSAEISFVECQGANGINNDLGAYYERLVQLGKASQTELNLLRGKYIVGEGQCEAHIEKFLDSKGYQIF